MSSDIFSPKEKIISNIDRVLELFETGITSPVLVEIDPSNACNHGCYFCISSYIHLPESKHLETYDRSVMSKDVLMSLCKDIVKMNVRAVNWTGGGEPTVNSNLKYAIEYLGKHNVKMGMFTNGTLLDRFNLFETLVNNMSWVRFSIDAGNEKTYNTIRRPSKNQTWSKMINNLEKLISVNNKIDIGLGFVITPDTYTGIIDFANKFKDYDVKYCQYKPEIVNRERENGVQRKKEFWQKIEPLLKEAKNILGSKFQINDYKLEDLEVNTENYGRTYKKCLGSQISPAIGADGEVYVCTNHRGYKQYSYGNLNQNSFDIIWNNIQVKNNIMHKIDNVEKFKNCTQLCKPHESNKAIWNLYEEYNNSVDKEMFKNNLYKQKLNIDNGIIHKEFI